MAFITSYVAVTNNNGPFILGLLTILLVVVTTNAIFGNINLEHQKSYTYKLLQLFFFVAAAFILSALIAPAKLVITFLCGIFLILFIELEVRMLIHGKHKENVSKHDFVYGSAKLSIDLVLSVLVLLVIFLILVMMFGSDDGGDIDENMCESSC